MYKYTHNAMHIYCPCTYIYIIRYEAHLFLWLVTDALYCPIEFVGGKITLTPPFFYILQF